MGFYSIDHPHATGWRSCWRRVYTVTKKVVPTITLEGRPRYFRNILDFAQLRSEALKKAYTVYFIEMFHLTFQPEKTQISRYISADMLFLAFSCMTGLDTVNVNCGQRQILSDGKEARFCCSSFDDVRFDSLQFVDQYVHKTSTQSESTYSKC